MAERASSLASSDLTAQMLRHNLSLRPVFVKVARQGGAGKGNNPEQLFAAGYSACFLGAIKAVAASDKSGPKVPQDSTVTATVGIGPRSEGGFGITAALEVSLPGLEKSQAEALVQKAHQVCPYSNATRNNVDVQITVV